MQFLQYLFHHLLSLQKHRICMRGLQNILRPQEFYRAPRFWNSWIRHWVKPAIPYVLVYVINSREYRQINLYANLETCGKITIQKQCLFSHSISLEMSVLSIDEKKKIKDKTNIFYIILHLFQVEDIAAAIKSFHRVMDNLRPKWEKVFYFFSNVLFPLNK